MRKLVTAVIMDKNGRFLLMKRRLGWTGWEFMKGSVEREGLRAAVLREMKEETGARGKIICRLPIEIAYGHKTIRGHDSSRQTAFLVEYAGGRIRQSPEHSGYKWATADEAGKLLTYRNQRVFLMQALKYIKERRKKLIESLSRKHVYLVRYDGKNISLKYDGRYLKCAAVMKSVKDIGDWSRRKRIVYCDRNLAPGAVLPILVHEMVERHVALTYGLEVDTEAHTIAQSVEKEFVADKAWIRQVKKVTEAWVKANHRKVGKIEFY